MARTTDYDQRKRMNPPEPTRPQPTPDQPGSASQRSFSWLMPVVLVSPALISLVATWCCAGITIFAIALCASILAGIGSSYLTVRNSSIDLWLKILWFIFLLPIYSVVAFTISTIGCALGQSMGGQVVFP